MQPSFLLLLLRSLFCSQSQAGLLPTYADTPSYHVSADGHYIAKNGSFVGEEEEIHLLISWQASSTESLYYCALKEFDVVTVETHPGWQQHSERVSRMNSFYERTRNHENVDDDRGKEQFTIIIAKLHRTLYTPCKTGSALKGGAYCAPTSAFKAKMRKAHNFVHVTDNPVETRENLVVLGLGSYSDYMSRPTLPLAWNSPEALFASLNNRQDFAYVVSRNWEGFPSSITTAAHADIDFMTDDITKLASALGSLPAHPPSKLANVTGGKSSGMNRVQYLVALNRTVSESPESKQKFEADLR